jgi:putative SOS response-associated peptidase YedK
MCGRFALDAEVDELIEEFVLTHNRFPDWAPRFNIAPTQSIPIVLERTPGVRELGPARWSLVPSWSQELTLKYPTFNARSETAHSKPTFRGSVKHHRCLIPATGYYEWAVVSGTKVPHFIYSTTTPLLALAGLYSWWSDPETQITHATATILTREATGVVRDIHDRMPLLVSRDTYSTWLNPEDSGGEGLIGSLVAETEKTSNTLAFHPVAPLRGEGASLIVPSEISTPLS